MTDSSVPHQSTMRLHRFLAAAGLGSRRSCEELVVSGRVTVDGDEVHDVATVVDPARQEVRLDGEVIRAQRKRYFLVNKPAGYVCTNRDPAGRPRAVDLVPFRNAPRLFTVGRLDESSLGLLLITNDGELANRLAHPRYAVPRTYRVQVAGIPNQQTLAQLRRGLYFPEGRFQVKSARRLKTQGDSAFLELEMTQGRNREIRRMLARVGHKVLNLERIAFGPLRLGRLAPGECLELSRQQVAELIEFAFSAPAKRKGLKYRQRIRTRQGKKSSRGKSASPGPGPSRSAKKMSERGRPSGGSQKRSDAGSRGGAKKHSQKRRGS